MHDSNKFKMARGANLKKMIEVQDDQGPLAYWETVPVRCGFCKVQKVGFYVVSACYESLIDSILIDLENGVGRLPRAEDIH